MQQVPLEGGRIDALVFGQVAGQLSQGFGELPLRARTVAAAGVMPRHRRVDERLHEESFLPGRAQPHRLPRLVGLEVFAPIVERRAFAQSFPHSCIIEVVANWLDRLRGKAEAGPAPLRGAPAVARLKNYAALSGYAYEYVYDGYRDLPACREFVFRFSGDRKNWYPLSVRLSAAAMADWERGSGQSLRDNEKYAAAKLALFAAFDERPEPSALRQPVDIDAPALKHLLAQAGLE